MIVVDRRLPARCGRPELTIAEKHAKSPAISAIADRPLFR
jgi:hypothetical protein